MGAEVAEIATTTFCCDETGEVLVVERFVVVDLQPGEWVRR